MEGPGGYQFVGRTVQIWNTHRQTANFTDGKPWLLRFFDRIRFYPVDHETLAEMRDGFLQGEVTLEVEEGEFDLAAYHAFLADHRTEIDAFRRGREQAFAEERHRWEEQGIAAIVDDTDLGGEPPALNLPDGTAAVEAPMNGSVWKILVEPGEVVVAGQKVAVLEAMKTEIAVETHLEGQVAEILCKPGKIVKPGEALLTIEKGA